MTKMTMLLTCLFYVLVVLTTYCWTWTSEIIPNRQIKYEPGRYEIFNGTGTDYFKILDVDDSSILIGSKNNVYNISFIALRENVKERITWNSSDAHTQLCILKGKQSSTDCQNYIRLFARVAERQIMICGTNSFKPLCRYYKQNPSGDYEMLKESDAQAICPYSPIQNSTYIYIDNQLYTATVSDFSGSEPLIYRERLSSAGGANDFSGLNPERHRTDRYSHFGNDASFVSAVEFNGYIMFFFREQAIEYSNYGKSIYSRVGRICKNDKGGSHPYSDRFTTFLKTRLNCSVPGDYPFYFNELQATSKLVNGIYGNDKDTLIYTVITTGNNAIDGSAICVYSMNSILEAFEGRFKSRRDMDSIWKPIEDNKVPTPRPGKCTDDSRTLPGSTINFVFKNPIMNDAIQPVHGEPLLIQTGMKHKFSAIVVNPQISALNGKAYDVIYLGTDSGSVIKLINAESADSKTTKSPVVISEQQVLPYGTRVTELLISQSTQTLIAIADNHVVSIPLNNCGIMVSCSECINLQDPSCVWDQDNKECVFYVKSVNATKETEIKYMQSINEDGVCKDSLVVPFMPKKNTNVVKTAHGTVSSIGKFPMEPSIEDAPEIEETEYKKHHYSVVSAPQNDEIIELAGPSTSSITIVISLVTLLFGIAIGFCLTRCYTSKNPFHYNGNGNGADVRNQLGWQVNKRPIMQLPSHHHPLNNGGKDINLLMNTNTSTINHNNKKDNLELEYTLGSKDRTHETKNSNESLDKHECKSAVISAGGGMSTLQKVKKTYI